MSTPHAPEQYLLFDLGIDISQLRSLQQKLMSASKAKNTIRAYAHRWRVFAEWSRRAGRLPLPATQETVKLYITWALEVYGSRLETVKLTMSAIADKHRSSKLASPVDGETRAFLVQCARHLQEEPRGRDPITVKQLLKACDRLGNTPLDLRDRAILLLGFASGWRGDELASLRMSSISFTDEGVVLRLGKAKNDQEGRGRIVGIHHGSKARTCPVRALQKWIKARGDMRGPLFLRFNSPTYMFDEGISRQAICLVVQRRLERAGVRLKRSGSHSMRAGLITSAVSRGVSELAIMDRTGQRSIATMKRYVRPAQAFRFNPVAGVL